MTIFFLLFLVASAADPISAQEPPPREVMLRVIEPDGSPLAGAILKVCRLGERDSKVRPCESLVSTVDGVEVVLKPAAQYTIDAHLDGFLATTVGPIEVNPRHYPSKEIHLLLNPAIMN